MREEAKPKKVLPTSLPHTSYYMPGTHDTLHEHDIHDNGNKPNDTNQVGRYIET